MALPDHIRDWFVPLSNTEQTLGDAFNSMQDIALEQGSIPLIVQLVENPKFDIPGIDIFNGATNLETHDYIHLLLGRGLLPKDEAFVLGFTMGSTNRVTALEKKLYELFTRFLYPKHYQFDKDDFQVYQDSVRLGYISDCTPLNKVNFEELSHLSLDAARKKIGIEAAFLKAYYEIEKNRYPESFESARLLDGF
jgi:hypothetical protein